MALRRSVTNKTDPAISALTAKGNERLAVSRDLHFLAFTTAVDQFGSVGPFAPFFFSLVASGAGELTWERQYGGTPNCFNLYMVRRHLPRKGSSHYANAVDYILIP